MFFLTKRTIALRVHMLLLALEANTTVNKFSAVRRG